ncbi:hypothetical protein BUALT_Bualt01G0246200 [Buddleja alternifolia]|uniref:DDE Tnp4 domain-containing protein n=1 Tax=Buddleja alternifolia TaxID=168488 RepID=A0AAV6Y9V3_9LAMI|nr:hypothetical protein BUALT_Bualt01G0246200 [Buddleja alternifolia]
MARLTLARRKKVLYLTLEWYMEQLNILTWTFYLICVIVMHHAEKYCLKSKYRLRDYKRSLYLDGLIYESDKTCYEELRMDRFTFRRLCCMLQATGRLKETRNMTIDEQVAMFLHILAHHLKNRTIKIHFLRSGETVSRYFNRVLKVVLQLQGELLKAPEPVSEHSTNPRWKWFKNCLGALDGTYIEVIVREEDKPRYRNRKGDIATNVLGVCSQDMQFIYVLPGWEGSAADGRILRDALNCGFLKKPFIHYDQLAIIWGKDRATGNNSEAPGDIIEDLDNEQEEENDDNTDTMACLDDIDSRFTQPSTVKRLDGESSKQGPRKRRKSVDGLMSGLKDIVEMMGNHLKESREQMSNMINVIAAPEQQNMDNR